MSRLFTFLVGMAVGAASWHGATNYHLVRADDGMHLVHKVRSHLSEAYVDVRGFGVGEWSDRPELVAALTQQDKAYLMKGATVNSLGSAVDQYLPNWPQQ